MVTYADRLPPAGDWRQGAAAVAVLSFDVDAEAPILAEGDPRILKLLTAREIEATFFVPGVTAERWSGTVEEILQSGHEVALHGHSHRVLPGMSESKQRRDLEICCSKCRAPRTLVGHLRDRARQGRSPTCLH